MSLKEDDIRNKMTWTDQTKQYPNIPQKRVKSFKNGEGGEVP